MPIQGAAQFNTEWNNALALAFTVERNQQVV
jgi:hypothetical protein